MTRAHSFQYQRFWENIGNQKRLKRKYFRLQATGLATVQQNWAHWGTVYTSFQFQRNIEWELQVPQSSMSINYWVKSWSFLLPRYCLLQRSTRVNRSDHHRLVAPVRLGISAVLSYKMKMLSTGQTELQTWCKLHTCVKTCRNLSRRGHVVRYERRGQKSTLITRVLIEMIY